MLRNELLKKGLLKTPVRLEYSILSYSENRLQIEQNDEERILGYLDWIPFAFLLLTIKDIIQGKKITVSPVIEF